MKKIKNANKENQYDRYMDMAIELAYRAEGETYPNPMVGALIVQDDKVISRFYHQRAGEVHAERGAIENVSSELTTAAVLYVTLEPCSHTNKRTPPCVQSILKSPIKKVIIGCLDPNPKVSGRGVKALEEAGIEVIKGVREKEAQNLIKVFQKNITQKKTFISLKWAQTLDGMLADSLGQSKWITGEEARSKVHQLRRVTDGLLVGMGTVKKDNPRLTIRSLEEGLEVAHKNRIIVVDPHGELHADYHLVKENGLDNIWIITTKNHQNLYKDFLPKQIIKFETAPVDLKLLEEILFTHHFHHIMVEAGPRLLSSFIKYQAYDQLWCFIAPKIMGGGLGTFSPLEFKDIKQSIELMASKIKVFGKDIFIEYHSKK